jgi:hypothetical protein
MIFLYSDSVGWDLLAVAVAFLGALLLLPWRGGFRKPLGREDGTGPILGK